MPNLVIFDIDGTLLNTSAVDEECFVQSIEQTFDIHNIDTRWENYRNASDAAILEEIFERALGRKPTAEEVRLHIESFLKLLQTQCERNAVSFREVSGAAEMLHVLRRRSEWKPALATGGWRETALFKLQCAGLDVSGIPMVTSSEASTREAVIKNCIETAKTFYRVTQLGRIVSVGDAIWDARAAKRLGIAFIRINSRHKKDNLVLQHVLEDFLDVERFLKYLEEATTPA